MPDQRFRAVPQHVGEGVVLDQGLSHVAAERRQPYALAEGLILLGQFLFELAALHAADAFGLALYLPDLLEEIDEARDLRPDDNGNQRLDKVIHRAQRIGPIDREAVAFKGRKEDDGSASGFFPAADQLGRLEAIQAGHLDVQQHDGEVVVQQTAQGFLAGTHFHEVLAEVRENRLERHQVGWLVVHQENVRLRFGRQGFTRFVVHGPAIAFRLAAVLRTAAKRGQTNPTGPWLRLQAFRLSRASSIPWHGSRLVRRRQIYCQSIASADTSCENPSI
jgi:hypothetical protein